MSRIGTLLKWASGLIFLLLILSFAGTTEKRTASSNAKRVSRDRPVGKIQLVATFNAPMPTGVTVSHSGRIFVNFPRWGDPVAFTVAEIKNGRPVPYPDKEINRLKKEQPADAL